MRKARVLAIALAAVVAIGMAHAATFRALGSQAQAVNPQNPGMVEDARVVAIFDDALTRVDVDLRVVGGSTVMAAHFHCGRPGQGGPVAFGLFSPGNLEYDGQRARGTMTNADFNGADCVPVIGRPVNNIAALAYAMQDGLIYLNVHTAQNPGGEFRGQMVLTSGSIGPSNGPSQSNGQGLALGFGR